MLPCLRTTNHMLLLHTKPALMAVLGQNKSRTQVIKVKRGCRLSHTGQRRNNYINLLRDKSNFIFLKSI
jgi:hypothetical protein